MKKILIALLMTLSTSSFAAQYTGKISKLDFYGSGQSEAIFVTLEPKTSVCVNKGRFIMYTKDRPAITSALIAAYHAKSAVMITGKGHCHSAWTSDEELDYATFL